MKVCGLLLTLLAGCALAAAGQTSAAAAVGIFRESRDRQFRQRERSPLEDADFKAFDGLQYYAFDARYDVEARFEKATEQKVFLMPNSSGGTDRYVVVGVLRFTLEGRAHALTAYQQEAVAAGQYPNYRNIVFVPFRDLTNGKETYGAGRFLDIRIGEDGAARVDFNLAYNPHCSYGSRFACPLPPRENFLQAKIEAGEKRFVTAKEKVSQ